VILISKTDLKNISKKNKWLFDWKFEFKQPQRDVYKLTIVNNEAVIQGLMSVEVKSDHVYMHLVKSAPFNKGKTKMYAGVAGNLVAFACKLAFQRGTKATFLFFPKHNSCSIILKHWVQNMLEVE
jgi:hypothetical protein